LWKKLNNIAGVFMEEISREQIKLQSAEFKKNWIEFAKVLSLISQSKIYESWGYQNIYQYATKELRVKKETVIKLLSSFQYIEDKNMPPQNYDDLPSLDSLAALQKLKEKYHNKKEQFENLEKEVFEKNLSPSTIYRYADEFLDDDDQDKTLTNQKIRVAKNLLDRLESLLLLDENLPEAIKQSIKDIRNYLTDL